MENSLGLDVHGENTSQSPNTTQPTASWGVDTESSASWGVDNQAQASWGVDTQFTVKSEEDILEDSLDTSSPPTDDKSKREKGKPYVPVTPPARAKMSPEELAERMEKIRLQNEKIKERREHVKADEEAFNTSIAADRARQAANRKVQAQINQNREQNAKRKLEKMGNREWDSGKHGGDWKQGNRGKNKPSSGPVRDGGPRAMRNISGVSLPSAVESASREVSSHISQEDLSGSTPSPSGVLRESQRD